MGSNGGTFAATSAFYAASPPTTRQNSFFGEPKKDLCGKDTIYAAKEVIYAAKERVYSKIFCTDRGQINSLRHSPQTLLQNFHLRGKDVQIRGILPSTRQRESFSAPPSILACSKSPRCRIVAKFLKKERRAKESGSGSGFQDHFLPHTAALSRRQS